MFCFNVRSNASPEDSHSDHHHRTSDNSSGDGRNVGDRSLDASPAKGDDLGRRKRGVGALQKSEDSFEHFEFW